MNSDKIVLGLDLGIGSIGWAIIQQEINEDDTISNAGKILGIGSRIIPTDAELLINFEKGSPVSKTADRRQARNARRQLSRYKARRARLITALKILGWVSEDFKPGDALPVGEKTLIELKDFFGENRYQNDWVVYFLRHKALTQKIELGELARILYQYNQRRGFKSSRKTDQTQVQENADHEETDISKPKLVKEIILAQVMSVVEQPEKYKGNSIYELTLSNGDKGTIIRKTKPDWEGQEIELEKKIKTTKKGDIVSFSMPDKTNWVKQKEALEKNIAESEMYLSSYYLYQFKKNPNYRIKDNIIERKRYEDELKEIWKVQKEMHEELRDNSIVQTIAERLYKNNLTRQQVLKKRDLEYILLQDIIYYQRPLRSAKHLIGKCTYETFTVKKGAEEFKQYQKVAPISHPIAQEFRIWQTIHNIRIAKIQEENEAGKIILNADVTHQVMTPDAKAKLFELFDQKERVSEASILACLKLSSTFYKTNVFDDTLAGNKTKALFRSAFKRAQCEDLGEDLLQTPEQFEQLWHLLYSLDEAKDIANTLYKRYGEKGLTILQATIIASMPAFKNDYMAYSTKAMRKLISVMQTGVFFNPEKIDPQTKLRIDKIINGEFDHNIDIKTREKFNGRSSINDFQGLDKTLAIYVVYGAESVQKEHYTNPDDIKPVPLHSLRNPLVEQLTNETLKLVRDIWKELNIRPNEIHIELARDLKKSANERKRISTNNKERRDDNARIVAILKELEHANPYSVSDIERLKLWEETGNEEAKNNPIKFKSNTEPTKAEIEKYKLWGNQNHISPYTGKVIPLNKLFDKNQYQIDHIIPRSRHFDDSFSNKVICEAEVNKAKDNRTGMEYMEETSSKEELDAYVQRIKSIFKGMKQKYLLMEKPPEDFVNRQLTNTRYISRKVHELLQGVPEPIEGAVNTIIATSGEITHELRHRWGLGEKMKHLLIPRFERLQTIVKDENDIITKIKDDNGNIRLSLKGYDKRIDHRHHALDALVIACTGRQHIQFFNTLNSQSEDQQIAAKYKNIALAKRNVQLPWPSFNEDAVKALSQLVVSFKSGKNVLQKAQNKYSKIERNGASFKKITVKQDNANLWSLRTPLHKETRSGEVKTINYTTVTRKKAIENFDLIADKRMKKIVVEYLKRNNNDVNKTEKELKDLQLKDGSLFPSKLELRTYENKSVNRVRLDETFETKKIETKVTDKGLQKILLEHLKKYKSPKEAFTGEGIEALNKGRQHPIRKVRVVEDIGSKFNIGKDYPVYVEAAKGTNLFFLIYENTQTQERIINSDSSLSLSEILPLIKQGLPIAESKPDHKWITISPNDLVYMPDEDEAVEQIDWTNLSAEQQGKIYKMVSCVRYQCFFVPHTLAKVIVDKIEFETGNKSEKAIDGRMIKMHFIKLLVDRLGRISLAPWNN